MLNTLTHYIQLMSYNFIYLDLSITQTVRSQIPHLEKLGLSINRLRLTLDGLPPSCERLDRGARHDIRNELSIINTRAQLLRSKSSDELGCDGRMYLQNILNASNLFIKALETTKAPTAERA